MKERPILYSTPMVRGMLNGSKTQTRRVVKPQPINEDGSIYDGKVWGPEMYEPVAYDRHGEMVPGPEVFGIYTEDWGVKCPYGKPGDQLWVRETWRKVEPSECGCSEACSHGSSAYDYRATGSGDEDTKWKPSIHMPRRASRIQLEITGIRVERLQDISDDDALAEGVISYPVGNLTVFGVEGTKIEKLHPRAAYLALWDEINGRGSADANPWVWVVEFKVIKP
jgi:hypothetical protein